MTARSKSSQQADSRLNQWLAQNKSSPAGPAPMKKLPANEQAPLSFGQLRLWFLQKLNPGNPFYHYAELYSVKGRLKKDRFISSFKELVRHHEILRTTFPEDAGTPWQQVNPSLDPEVIDMDLRSLSETEKTTKIEQIALQEANKPFDLIHGPLIRIGLFQMKEDHFQVILVMHHIIGDQWSMDLIRREWASLYQGKDLKPSEYRYLDFAFDQRQRKINKTNLQYWSRQLAGDIPKLEFPLSKRNMSRVNSYKGSCHRWSFSSDTSMGLKQLTKDSETTMFILLLSIFKVMLFRLSGESDVLVATPVSNRKHKFLETMVGFFNETVVLRDRLIGDMTFIDLVKNVQATVFEAFAHNDIPFESIVKTLMPDRMMSTNPLFQVMFLYHKTTDNPALGPDVAWEYRQLDIGVSKFDLTLHIHEDQDQLSAIFEYSHDLFEPDVISKMQRQLDRLVAGVLEDINLPISKLPILSTEEQSRITSEWNHPTNSALPYKSINEMIASSIRRYPQKKAVVSDTWVISYEELDQLAGYYSAILADKGIGKGEVVGIFAEKSVEMIIGVLAVLKTGATYVPLDADYPPARLEYIIKDAKTSTIITQKHLADKLSAFSVGVVPIEIGLTEAESLAAEQSPDIEGSSCAYIMYTSGSTGQPKGVKITHANLVSSTIARDSFYPNQPKSFLLMSSFGFDSSVAGIFWTLCSGGTLVLPQDRIEQDMIALSDLIEKHQITHTLLLPSLYNLLLQHGSKDKLESLNTVIVAGESCSIQTCSNHFKHLSHVNLYNEYGPTEATVWSSVHHIQKDDLGGPIPIGRPIENSRIYLLDQNLNLVPAGVVGEIFICGQGVSTGYQNLPDLSASRFITSPFSQDNGRKMYRTGDLGRYKSNGVIEYMGRADKQIKLRGFRIELDEINNTLITFPGVNESAVAMKSNTDSAESLQEANVEALVSALEAMDSDKAETLLSAVELVDQFNYIQ